MPTPLLPQHRRHDSAHRAGRTGTPFELVLVDRTVNAHKAPGYLRLNPNGLIPGALTDGDLVLYETAAITLHLCDTHPQAGLAPALARRSARSSTSG